MLHDMGAHMNVMKFLMTAGVIGVALAGSACSDKATADTKKAAGETAAATKDVAQQTVSTTKEIASDISEKGGAAASSTAAEFSDGWITTKVKAKFADEKLLEGNKVSVETDNHVVSLRGTVLSSAARTRAVSIARGTERVTGVVDLLVVE